MTPLLAGCASPLLGERRQMHADLSLCLSGHLNGTHLHFCSPCTLIRAHGRDWDPTPLFESGGVLGVCTRVGYVWEGWEFEALKIFYLPVDLWLLGGALSAAQMLHSCWFSAWEKQLAKVVPSVFGGARECACAASGVRIRVSLSDQQHFGCRL